MRTPRLLSCAVVTVLALSACTSGTSGEPGAGPSGGMAGGGTETAEPSGTPVPAELTTGDYRAELGKARGPIRDALKKLNATGGKGLDRRLRQTVATMEDAVTGLETLTPPSEVKLEHDDYVSTLRRFLSALSAAQEDVRAQDVCTGPAVLTGVREVGQLSHLRRSAAALADRGDYRTDVIPVKVTGERSRRLPNGRYIRSEGRPGRAYLELKNGNGRDAVVVLVRGKKKAVRVYIRRKSTFKVRGVRDGSYKVYYTLGTDWDSRVGGFTRSCSFEQFGRSVRFKTVYTATQIRWSNWTITLNAVVGGTVSPRHLKPGDFPG
ncbi:hypothetical protein [Streptosporangium sp. NPDC087985]|uniref:hypothetical protein n=1 Tax=Streptosporangium sp. NPDC087985 TaxID=3366196 RepID=UPI0037FCD38F